MMKKEVEIFQTVLGVGVEQTEHICRERGVVLIGLY